MLKKSRRLESIKKKKKKKKMTGEYSSNIRHEDGAGPFPIQNGRSRDPSTAEWRLNRCRQSGNSGPARDFDYKRW